MSNALVLVDFQKEWTNPESDDFLGDIKQLVQRTNKLIDFCRKKGCKIIFTRHVEKDSVDAWSEKSEGTRLLDELHKEKQDVIITKHKISPFYQSKLDKELGDSEKIIVAGILTNMCVRSLIQDAYDRDFEITVIKDCCATYDKKTQEFTFKDLKATREKIEFLNVKEFVKST